MASNPLDIGRLPAAVAVIAALLAPLAVMAVTNGSGAFSLASVGLLPAAVFVGGPRLWPGWGRFGSLILIGPGFLTAVFPGLVTLFVVGFSLCSSDQTRSYLTTSGAVVALAAFLVPYALGSLWALARPSRALWAWPIVILASIAIGLAVLALVEGGPHHCET